jgi:hypothetical protein
MSHLFRASLISIWLGVLLPSPAWTADSVPPVFEGFLGLSATNLPSNVNGFAVNGYHFSLALNANSFLRPVVEFAGHYGTTGIQTNRSDQGVRRVQYQLLAGPEFVLRRRSRIAPFARSLIGMAAQHYYVPSGDPEFPRDVLAVDYGLALALGGGLDIALSHHWALRAAQFDYLLTHLEYDQPELSPIRDQLPDMGSWQHCFRFSLGVVLRLGNPTP